MPDGAVTDYRIIPYEPTMLREIVRLWEESRGPSGLDRREKVFRWFTEQNPFLRRRPPYWCLHDGTRVVGMHGHMPVVLDVDGHELQGHMAQDDLLHPSCRGKGLGQVLLDGVKRDARDFSAAMWFNDANHKSYSKAGWVDVPGFRTYIRFLDASVAAKHISRPALASLARIVGPMVLRVIDLPGRLRSRRALHLETVKNFDERFDNLWLRSKAGLGITVRRDAAYLNWRYVAMPTLPHERLAAIGEGSNAAGFVVWRPIPLDGDTVFKIMDIVWDHAQAGAVERLLLGVVDAGRAQGVSRVLCAASNPGLVAALKSTGFVEHPDRHHHMISNWEGHFRKEDVTNVKRWHLTFGDADGDIWNEN